MRKYLFIFLINSVTLSTAQEKAMQDDPMIEVKEIKLNPTLKEARQIGSVSEDSCVKTTYAFGDTFLNLEHVHYRNSYCMFNYQYQKLFDTLIIGNTLFDVQNEIIKIAPESAKDYFRGDPVNVLVTRLFSVKTINKLFYIICFLDTNIISGTVPDDFIILYDQTDRKILLFDTQAEVTNYEALFGDFDKDGTIDFISWDYGEAKLISLDGQRKKYKNVEVEIDETERYINYKMEVINKNTGSKTVRELIISSTLADQDYRN